MNILYGIIVCDILGTATASQASALLRRQSTTNQLLIKINLIDQNVEMLMSNKHTKREQAILILKPSW